MSALLQVEGLDAFYGKAHVLRGVDLRVEEGEFVSVLGANGAGKTTLFNVISRLKPARGKLLYRGRPLPRRPHEVVDLGLVHCPEHRRLFPYMSVKDNLLLGAYRRRDREVQHDLRAVYALFPRLEERAQQWACTLSGGEQQMLAIGRALMSRPTLLLLDEPTIGLAPIVRRHISEALDQIRTQGVTILLSEQNVVFALEHSDRIYLLETGEVVKAGTAEAFKQDPHVRRAYLGETV